ncbi:MAG TPA: hypothetical protein VHX44_14690 [Planctomycetota bacterium]|nr:hypothetical protein [Planctomycetota bacterium]
MDINLLLAKSRKEEQERLFKLLLTAPKDLLAQHKPIRAIDYLPFVKKLKALGWETSGASFAQKFVGKWQVVFVREYGRFVPRDEIVFWIGVRFCSESTKKSQDFFLKETSECWYPFRPRLEDIYANTFTYVNEYEENHGYSFPPKAKWAIVLIALQMTERYFANSYTKKEFIRDILAKGKSIQLPDKRWLKHVR